MHIESQIALRAAGFTPGRWEGDEEEITREEAQERADYAAEARRDDRDFREATRTDCR